MDGLSTAQNAEPEASKPTDGIVTKPSPLTVSETVRRLTGLVEDRN
jgi:hypothetical protein